MNSVRVMQAGVIMSFDDEIRKVGLEREKDAQAKNQERRKEEQAREARDNSIRSHVKISVGVAKSLVLPLLFNVNKQAHLNGKVQIEIGGGSWWRVEQNILGMSIKNHNEVWANGEPTVKCRVIWDDHPGSGGSYNEIRIEFTESKFQGKSITDHDIESLIKEYILDCLKNPSKTHKSHELRDFTT